MFHMPCAAFRFGALIRQNDLIARATSWFERFSVMSAAVKFSIAIKVDKIDEQLLALGANKTARVPTDVRARSCGEHGHVRSLHFILAVFTAHGRHKLFDETASESFSLALRRKQAQLFSLVLGETVTVADLVVMRR